MKVVTGRIRLSATDLANHVACRHLTALDLAVAEERLAPPESTAWLPASMQQRGDAHERTYVEHLRAAHAHVVDLRECRFDIDGFRSVREAMQSGADILLQAPLGDERWIGRADVLRRVERPSGLGAWAYEPVDTKLARETRGSAILQLCAYADMLAAVQGERPEWMHVVSPGRPFIERQYRVDDFFAYFSLVRHRLLAFLEGSAASQTYPDPVAHCEICRWMHACGRRRRADDHLGFVANIHTLHIAEFTNWNLTTLAALGGATLPFAEKPQRASLESLEKAQRQARIQLDARVQNRLIHEPLPLVPSEGLFRLPAPSPGDVFLDLEGDPFVGEAGHEFLFGYAYVGPDGEWRYTGHWALDAEQEKRAFAALLAFLITRWAQHPDLHVYHYAPYEPAAIRRLTGKHAVCEDEVDRLLRGRVFVDLYAVVRQAIRASVERYSIKDLEPFYGFTRGVPLADVGPHLRAVQLRLELGSPADLQHGLSGDTLSIVEGYNRDDCLSARDLRDWLESIRSDWERQGFAIARPAAASADAPEALGERELAVRALMERLLADAPADVEQRSPDQHARWLLAQMLEFHRREDKAVWWEFYRLAELPSDDVLDEASAVGGLEHVARIGGTKKCPIDRYRFPPQELTRPRGEVRSGTDVKVGEVAQIDLDARTIDIKKTGAAANLHPSSVFFHQRINPKPLPDALFELGAWVADRELDADGPYRAVRRLLLNAPPVFAQDTPWTIPGESAIERAERLAVALRDSVLPVQGPPGSGKTHTAAHMVCALIRAGRTVGITATSHRVIRNLLDTILEVAAAEFLVVRGIQKVGDDEEIVEDGPIRTTKTNVDVLEALQTGTVSVAAGTAWLWARREFQQAVDVLIVDEAGQMALANVLAAGQAAGSLVLLGDPQQLEQPLKGSHPMGTEVSVLQHVLGASKTLPDERGLFLAETWRLAPSVCAFTSELFYEGRLRPKAGLERQRIDGPADPTGAGLWFLPVEHGGNQSCSIAEVAVVCDLVRRLASGSYRWTDDYGASHALTYDDVLVVAPYNAQVYAIQERLPAARAGTVDRFQGQQAPVVVYTMATSSPEDAPRGMEFLYSLNRLNVATSRAKCVVVLVASPKLFEPDCQTPRQMQLANAFCRYLEMARLLDAETNR